ncbi:ThiF family adenylyltransferase [Gemmobacter caeruleus]|uniref:ThiF family adenylyltransferase n=1 Tax=Gemmobacter caeruleus TaxID=2595004 RepID=UPI00193ABA5A|nr:ThiF family adenylyltransferase [Gemmobacter caeruleus]
MDIKHSSSFTSFVQYLYGKGILVRKDWMQNAFRPEQVKRYSRQLNFFLDIEESEAAATALLKRIMDCRVALIGVGAVGSWILRELVQIGFQRFIIVDPKELKPADRTRNAFFDHRLIGRPKAMVAESFVHGQALKPETRAVQAPLDIDTNVEKLIGSDVDLIINTADEPYIGATSIKLSRYCVTKRLPLLVAGGFDAHLASLSEMIVPGQTPCSDCYAKHFEETLRGWKPISHPIVDRRRGFGGLPSLSAFAASAAVLKIVRLLSERGGDIEQGRGEFLFDQYSIDSFKVGRNPECPTCGDLGRLRARAD